MTTLTEGGVSEERPAIEKGTVEGDESEAAKSGQEDEEADNGDSVLNIAREVDVEDTVGEEVDEGDDGAGEEFADQVISEFCQAIREGGEAVYDETPREESQGKIADESKQTPTVESTVEAVGTHAPVEEPAVETRKIKAPIEEPVAQEVLVPEMVPVVEADASQAPAVKPVVENTSSEVPLKGPVVEAVASTEVPLVEPVVQKNPTPEMELAIEKEPQIGQVDEEQDEEGEDQEVKEICSGKGIPPRRQSNRRSALLQRRMRSP